MQRTTLTVHHLNNSLGMVVLVKLMFNMRVLVGAVLARMLVVVLVFSAQDWPNAAGTSGITSSALLHKAEAASR